MAGVDSIAVSLFTIPTIELIEALQCTELYTNGAQRLHRYCHSAKAKWQNGTSSLMPKIAK